jgi:hypothetical protein
MRLAFGGMGSPRDAGEGPQRYLGGAIRCYSICGHAAVFLGRDHADAAFRQEGRLDSLPSVASAGLTPGPASTSSCSARFSMARPLTLASFQLTTRSRI